MRKDEATLNIPNEMVFALPAAHRDLVKFCGTNDPSYLTVRNVLAGIDCRLRAGFIVRLPYLAPEPPPWLGSVTHQEVTYPINFKGHVRVSGEGVLEIERLFSVSDLQAKSPRELLNLHACRVVTLLKGFLGVRRATPSWQGWELLSFRLHRVES